MQRVETPLEAERYTVFFVNEGSNISIVREAWAKFANHQGLPIIHTVYVAGGHSKKWSTKFLQQFDGVNLSKRVQKITQGQPVTARPKLPLLLKILREQ